MRCRRRFGPDSRSMPSSKCQARAPGRDHLAILLKRSGSETAACPAAVVSARRPRVVPLRPAATFASDSPGYHTRQLPPPPRRGTPYVQKGPFDFFFPGRSRGCSVCTGTFCDTTPLTPLPICHRSRNILLHIAPQMAASRQAIRGCSHMNAAAERRSQAEGHRHLIFTLY